MADFPNPGRDVFTTGGGAGDGIIGRYVRVTVTKLSPRKDDYMFALAELRVTDRAGKNVALGRPVTALDSVEVAPRWQKSNLTDGVAPSVLSADEKKELERARDALLLGFADEPTKSRRAALLAVARLQLGQGRRCGQVRGSDQSLPPVAQFSRLTSVMRMSTDSGEPPSTSTLTRVISCTSLRFCSIVRPSIISTW
jgi:hypothetical protein